MKIKLGRAFNPMTQMWEAYNKVAIPDEVMHRLTRPRPNWRWEPLVIVMPQAWRWVHKCRDYVFFIKWMIWRYKNATSK